MRILVTGCAGFIGWKVTELLLSDGHHVVGVDNLNDAYDVRLKRWRLQQLEGHPNLTFHRLDICDRDHLRQVFCSPSAADDPTFDAVIHLAARAGVRQSVENPGVYFETNVLGTLNLLTLCVEHGVKKFVLASTSSLYGANNPRPFSEEANTDRPLSPYAASKKAAEAMCHTYHYLYGLDVTILRYFTVYGPAGRPDMSIFRFVKWIAEGEPVLVYGNGSQERDFTYIDDIARGTVQALRPLGYEVINLGSDRPISVQYLIVLLEKFLGREAQIVHRSRHSADVPATWAEISRARSLLGWVPKASIEEGLRQTVDWYLANRTWAREIVLP